MTYLHPFSPRHASWVSHSGSTLLVLRGERVNPNLRPVIFCHAFPDEQSATAIIDANLALGLYSLTSTGRTIIVPWCGANWGHPTTSHPAGGTGLGAIDDALDYAGVIGLPDRANLVGVSMGGLNALRWAETNPDNFGAARLFVPVVDMMSMYDQAGYQTSLAQVWSTGGRAAFEAATAGVDPVRNAADYTGIADRITVFAARDDTVIDWDSLEGFCNDTGIELTPSADEGLPGGGHLAWILSDRYDELDILRLFDPLEGVTPATPPPPPPPSATVPGAPTGVSAVRGAASATVTWSAPASDGGSAITGYRVTPFIGATAQAETNHASTATSTTIGGLTNGTAYTFKVAAYNNVGTGAQSSASASVTPATTPSAPAIIDIIGGDAQVQLGWTAPANTGGTSVTSYTITPYIGATAQSPIVTGTTATTRTITSLSNGTAYTFKVAATNAVGTGAQSAASAAVTPAAPVEPDPLVATVPDGYTRDWVMQFDTANWTLKNGAGTVTNNNAKALWNLMVNARQGSTDRVTGLWYGTQSYSLASNVETDTSAGGMIRLKADDVDTGTGTSLRAYSSAYIRTQTSFYQPLEGHYEALIRFPLGHSLWSCLWFTAYGSASRFEVDWPETFTADTPGRASLVFHSGDGSSGSYGGANLIGKPWMGNAWTWHVQSGDRNFTGPFPGSTRYGKAIDIADPSDPDNPPWTRAGFEVERVWNTVGTANTRYTIRMKFYLDGKLICTYLDPFDPNTGIGPAGQNATGWSGNYPKWVHDSFVAGASLSSFWTILLDNWVGGSYVGQSVTSPTTPHTYGSRTYTPTTTGTANNVNFDGTVSGITGSTGSPIANVPLATADRWPFYLDVKWIQRLTKNP
jgi:pimeloyl-ACP methyl ester carboxylesterase